jgi:hypothetical protein
VTDCSTFASTALALVPVLSALLTPIIAIATAYIAYQQWRTNRNKLKLDLFDRRFAVYDAARNLVRDVLTQTHPSDEQLVTFRAKTSEASFLLNRDIARYLTDEMWEKAAALNRLWFAMSKLAGSARQENEGQQREIRVWFESQLKVLDARFTKFLGSRTDRARTTSHCSEPCARVARALAAERKRYVADREESLCSSYAR